MLNLNINEKTVAMSLINHPPYDPYSYPAAPPPEAYAFTDTGNNINTLFISGLPDDVSVREIHNLFRHRPGFESCQLKYTGRRNQVFNFGLFSLFSSFCLLNCYSNTITQKTGLLLKF